MPAPTDADFTESVHAAWPSLYRTAYLMLGEHQLAEDLVQTALAKTYASWRRVKDLTAAPGTGRCEGTGVTVGSELTLVWGADGLPV